MLPSTETCKRWRERKFIRQPHRMVIALIVATAAGIYAIANYIVWKSEQPEQPK